MKRWSVLVSFILFLALCASLAAWTMQWLNPAQRAVAATPVSEAALAVQLDAASALFGTRKTSAPAATRYTVKGIILARQAGDSVAIVAIDGKPAQALQVGAEVVPGVTLKAVHPQFVLLAEGDRETRIEVPETADGLIAQAERPQRVDGTAVARTQTPEKPSDSNDAVPPRERRPRRR